MRILWVNTLNCKCQLLCLLPLSLVAEQPGEERAGACLSLSAKKSCSVSIDPVHSKCLQYSTCPLTNGKEGFKSVGLKHVESGYEQKCKVLCGPGLMLHRGPSVHRCEWRTVKLEASEKSFASLTKHFLCSPTR